MRLKKYEIRITVTKNLYDRIAQEATNRDTKIAAVARDKLAERFIPKVEPANTVKMSNSSQENSNSNISHYNLAKTEKRLSITASRIESLVALGQDQMKFVVTMIDQFYFDLMKHLPEIPKEFELLSETTAKMRHRQWLDKINLNLKS